MTIENLGLLAITAYLVGLIAMAEAARRARRDRTPSDHFLAGRQLSTFVLFLTLYATAYSGNSLLGFPGEAYRRGYSWIMATGFMMAIIVIFQALVPRLRPLAVTGGFVTPGDWVRARFGDEAAGGRLLSAVALLMALALANFLLAQLTAIGLVASEITAGKIPYAVGVVGLAALILLYETVGGMRAVAWTDALQGILMFFGLAALLGWLIQSSGGLSDATQQIARVRPSALALPDARECANWASSIALLGFASVVYPQAIQRIYAAESGASLRRSLACMSFMPLVTTLVVTLIGIVAIPRFEALGAIEADALMPRLLREWAAAGAGSALLAMLVFLGALAAIMSTADSVLLSLGSVIAVDLFDRPGGDPGTTRLGKRAAALVMVAAVGLALFPQVTLWRLIELKLELLIQCVPAFLLALHWPGLRAGSTLVGLLAGATLAGAAALADLERVGGIHVGVIGLGVNLLICIFGSLAERRSR